MTFSQILLMVVGVVFASVGAGGVPGGSIFLLFLVLGSFNLTPVQTSTIIALALGINPLHLGIVFIANLAIGLFTPPFGLNIFVAQSVLKRPMGLISRSVLPYIALYFAGVLIITYVPFLSTCLLS